MSEERAQKLASGDVDLFRIFSEHAERIIEAREGILLEDIISIQVRICKF